MLPLRLQADIGASFEARVIDARDRLLDGLDHRRLPLRKFCGSEGAGGVGPSPAVPERGGLAGAEIVVGRVRALFVAVRVDSVKDEWAGLNLRPGGRDQQMGEMYAMLEGIDTGRVLRFVLKADLNRFPRPGTQHGRCLSEADRGGAASSGAGLGGLERAPKRRQDRSCRRMGRRFAAPACYPEVFAAVAVIAPEKAAVI